MKKIILILILLISPCFAAQDFYQFTSPEQQQRFTDLTTELRCLVCQNQNIAESNAPLASDLRAQVYQQLQHGQTNQQIIKYLVARYGDYILYRPPVNGFTLGLWAGPFLLLFFGISYLIFYIRKKRRD